MPLSDGGYFPDPDSEYARWLNPEATTFESIDHYPCLVLLGEPGIGKSTAMDAACQHQNDKVKEGRANAEILILNLRSYRENESLINDLFESQIFKTWLSGSDRLVIFLDSYDECLLELKKLGQLLADQLQKYKSQIGRLYLRIACRTAVWPSFLENELRKIYGDEAYGIYQLAPLRRIDVEKAAAQEGFNSDSFLNAVRDKNVISFAIKPITLRFLLNMYRSQGTLDTKTNVDLYYNGCICLCEEPSESRVASEQQGDLDKNQRLIIAARIAAVTILSNREAVWSGIHQDEAPNQDFSIDSILGKYETYNNNLFNVSPQDIKETLDTGLFSARGENRLGWAHQSYAEFLAAWYINYQKTPIHEISELLFSDDQQARRLIPQLQQTAAWLAGMRQDVFDLIVESDTEALLTVDNGPREQTAKILVDHLLSDFSQGKIYDYYKYIDCYHRLQHADLANQLRPYIKLMGQANTTREFISNARHAAIRIAEQCRVIEIQQDLVDLALDTNEDNYLRSSAAHAISEYGEKIYKQRLKPLALDAGSDDSDDELKGYALWATWPYQISAAEMFDHLTKPKQPNCIGSYRIFIYSKLAMHLKPGDMPVALDWLKKRQGERDYTDSFYKLDNEITLKASQCLGEPDILRLFADIAFIHWEGHRPFAPLTSGQQTHHAFPSLEDENIRRALLEQVVCLACEKDRKPDTYKIYRDIAKPIDFSWILNKLSEANSHSRTEDEMWASLLRNGLDFTSPNHVDAILTASQTSSILQAAFNFLLEPIDLDSEEADQQKKFYKYRLDVGENPQLAQTSVPLNQQISALLNTIETGAPDDFWKLLNLLSWSADAYCDNSLVELDIRNLPGWLAADQEVQARIANAAKLYIIACDQRSCNWADSDQFDLSFMAGCKALHLLMHTDQALIYELSADCWKKWAAAVVVYPNEGNQDIAYLSLVQLAYKNAPAETISALECMLDRAKQNQQLIGLDRFANCWDEQLNTLIVNQLIDQPEYSKYHESLLENLIERREANATEFALNLIRQPPAPNNGDSSLEHQKVRITARILLENADSTIWPSVWQIIEGDHELGRDIIESISPIWLRDPKFALTETQLADFYLWLTKQYPVIENQSADHVADLRRRILDMLKKRGTPLACQEILRLSEGLPELPWLKQAHLEARNSMLSATWKPHEPRAVLDLITKHKIQKMKHKRDPKNVNNTFNVDSINANGDGNIFNFGPVGKNLGGFTPPKKEKSWQFWLMFGLTAIGTVAAIVDIPSQHLNKIKSLFKGNVVPELEQVKPPKVNR
jgi:predicted NACHT family NTPase